MADPIDVITALSTGFITGTARKRRERELLQIKEKEANIARKEQRVRDIEGGLFKFQKLFGGDPEAFKIAMSQVPGFVKGEERGQRPIESLEVLPESERDPSERERFKQKIKEAKTTEQRLLDASEALIETREETATRTRELLPLEKNVLIARAEELKARTNESINKIGTGKKVQNELKILSQFSKDATAEIKNLSASIKNLSAETLNNFTTDENGKPILKPENKQQIQELRERIQEIREQIQLGNTRRAILNGTKKPGTIEEILLWARQGLINEDEFVRLAKKNRISINVAR